jgi:hypothetical protein
MQPQQRSNKGRSTVCLLFLSLLSVSLVQAAEWFQWEPEDGGNGHLYAVVKVAEGISWPEADAEALRENPCSHLATITSIEESDFIAKLVRQSFGVDLMELQQTLGGGWIGGIQASGAVGSADGWRWVTQEPFVFTRWNAGEPNDFPFGELLVDEIFLELQIQPDGGSWNDCCQGLIGERRFYYVVESSTPAECFDYGCLDLKIPPGHLPPPGECELWHPGDPPGHQPPPAPCAYLKETAPPGVVVIDHFGKTVGCSK